MKIHVPTLIADPSRSMKVVRWVSALWAAATVQVITSDLLMLAAEWTQNVTRKMRYTREEVMPQIENILSWVSWPIDYIDESPNIQAWIDKAYEYYEYRYEIEPWSTPRLPTWEDINAAEKSIYDLIHDLTQWEEFILSDDFIQCIQAIDLLSLASLIPLAAYIICVFKSKHTKSQDIPWMMSMLVTTSLVWWLILLFANLWGDIILKSLSDVYTQSEQYIEANFK